VAAAEQKKREEHQRWYEKEKGLEEVQERKRREQERELEQMHTQTLNPASFSPLAT
jgi:afadin